MIRIGRFLTDLNDRRWSEARELPDWKVKRAKYIVPGKYEFEPDRDEAIGLDPLNSTHGTTYFLKRELEIPSEWGSEPVGFVFEAGGEGLVRVNGTPYHGVDRNHQFVPLDPAKVGARPLIEIELYDPIPEPVDPLNRQAVQQPPIRSIRAKLVRVNRPVESLWYTVSVLYDAVKLLPENDAKRAKLVGALEETMDSVTGELERRAKDAEWLGSVEQALLDKVRDIVPPPDTVMHMVGQSHIDVAWLWPVRETVRKTSRTFSTMNTLMEEYPDFVYSQSQPQLYAFAKEHYPELYEKIKERVAEGRWELVGGMWVEPDLNMPSGESLIRQMLYGQRFYMEQFGKRSNIEWLPDTFGYCASLPQILKHGGIEYFMTSKLNWNDTNVFPYDLFHWVGIDGTSILSFLNHGLNEHTKPKDVHEHWESYRQKDRHDEQMLLYGHGDGGGGVTREMVELVRRSEVLPGLPAAKFSTAAQFFASVSERSRSLPKWHGDLYLELHRGTYTTHAWNKRNNRKAEVLYREAEIWNSLAQPYAGTQQFAQAQQSLHEGWKLILLNQFHDIIPGTSIPEVYETSDREYERIFALGEESLNAGLQPLVRHIDTQGEGTPYIVFNSLGWERDEVVAISGGAELTGAAVYDETGAALDSDAAACGDDPTQIELSVRVPSIPAFGYKTVWVRQAGGTASAADDRSAKVPSTWETGNYLLEFNASGEIVRWFDKAAERELLKPGEKANELQLFHDRPTYWDAWDIDSRYEQQPAGFVELIDSKVVLKGRTKDVLRFTWRLNESTVTQDIVLYRNDRRVDFKTKVQWNETHKLLKAAFPVDVVTSKAAYEIPFGALERPTHRNTSWEQAQYEVCGHRWADLSEGGYGVSLLNDCKYGYDVKDGTLRLSLLRAPRWPDVTADIGEHEFTYSLYPHEGDWRSAHVVRKGMELNHPAAVVAGESAAGALPSAQSLIGLESEHVVLDAVKPAEDGDGIVLRFYESSGGRGKASLRWPFRFSKAVYVNALEEALSEAEPVDGALSLDFRPFEIKSVKLFL
ncbi:alpha-mannosidase [Paenibacillus thermotolerans]|uniref:alpha-mannosidase n=1 Tax=Paenibacillus thermotolerans TaxID=3027807 RepID=UPI0023681B8D|nr:MULTISPECIES: alpha-mannosidase [unclassified Paenibacillus]